ncbi:unnamed protein product [Meganyctiphanes norvegica]|uniref:Uncharacterized protein n=1 Tax=Meganyctiphanes norvegica TaxID=48144 RepID=A0AAV2PVA2_MEGNR
MDMIKYQAKNVFSNSNTTYLTMMSNRFYRFMQHQGDRWLQKKERLEKLRLLKSLLMKKINKIICIANAPPQFHVKSRNNFHIFTPTVYENQKNSENLAISHTQGSATQK